MSDALASENRFEKNFDCVALSYWLYLSRYGAEEAPEYAISSCKKILKENYNEAYAQDIILTLSSDEMAPLTERKYGRKYRVQLEKIARASVNVSRVVNQAVHENTADDVTQ